MARTAAGKAAALANALDAFLHDPARRPPGGPAAFPGGHDARAGAPPPSVPSLACPDPPAGSEQGAGSHPSAPLHLPHPDWLHHHLVVAGPADTVRQFQRAAAGAGTIPWSLDLDSLEEDWFLRLAQPDRRVLSLTGARLLAAQLRDAVERRHGLATARVGHSHACPFDLHALVPVPPAILRMGPDRPDALAWLWQHWGTTDALRHVAPRKPGTDSPPVTLAAGEGAFRCTFWSADWTPWRAFARIRADWPALRIDVRPDYGTG